MPLEDMFDTCMEIHKDTGYGCRPSMEKEGRKRYSNITRIMISKFLDFTKNCQEYTELKIKEKKKSKKETIVDTISLKRSAEIDLINMQDYPDGDFKWILNYQDLSTGLCLLRALKTNSAVDAAQALCEIFYEHGEASLLNCGNIKGHGKLLTMGR